MKKLTDLLLFIVLLFIFGCTPVYFDRFPGEKVNEVPEELRGDYYAIESEYKNEKWETGDTVRYTIKMNSYIERGDEDSGMLSKKETEVFLGDSVILSKYKSFYFLSFRESSLWFCTVIEQTKEGFDLTPVIVGNNVEEDSLMSEIKQYFSNVKIVGEKENKKVIVKTKEKEVLDFYNKHSKTEFYYIFKRLEQK